MVSLRRGISGFLIVGVIFLVSVLWVRHNNSSTVDNPNVQIEDLAILGISARSLEKDVQSYWGQPHRVIEGVSMFDKGGVIIKSGRVVWVSGRQLEIDGAVRLNSSSSPEDVKSVFGVPSAVHEANGHLTLEYFGGGLAVQIDSGGGRFQTTYEICDLESYYRPSK